MSAIRSAAPPPANWDDFASRQWDYFESADEAKFRWQTTCPVIASTEQQLVSVAAGEGRLLEIGCGEGGNLFHLGPRKGMTVGLDYSLAKTAFASDAIPWASFVCADAVNLPFRGGVFDRVLCRDVLHHVHGRLQDEAVSELFRVCRAGGEVVVIEPNGRNPLIALFALLVPAERGVFRSTPARVASLVRSVAPRIIVEMAQPLPVARALLHYRFGAPGLGRLRVIPSVLGAIDAVLRRLMPCALWAYIMARGLAATSRLEKAPERWSEPRPENRADARPVP
jgi:SAM-dependent methyltransferase